MVTLVERLSFSDGEARVESVPRHSSVSNYDLIGIRVVASLAAVLHLDLVLASQEEGKLPMQKLMTAIALCIGTF